MGQLGKTESKNYSSLTLRSVVLLKYPTILFSMFVAISMFPPRRRSMEANSGS